MNESLDELRAEMSRHKDWYHKIELGNGLVTPGRDFDDIWEVCRETMDKVDFRGKRVLDIGACDGRWSFEAEKRGAAEVVALDVFDYALERFLFCRRVLGSRVIPLYNVSVYNLADSLGRRMSGGPPGHAPYSRRFDIVLFFGVLYHLRDPMLGLAQVRSVVSDDGVVLIETAYSRNEERPAMFFNGGERVRFYNDVTTWWTPTLSGLAEMCETSLLMLEKDTLSTLEQDARTGRVGARLRPISMTAFGDRMAHEISNHYPSPLPKL